MKRFGTLLFCLLWATALWLSQNFVQGTEASASGCVGQGAADVVFLLDSSYSIWRPDFRRQLTFVQEVIDRLPIGPNNIRVAIVTYADYPQLQFHLHHYSVKSDLRAAVEGIQQRGGFQTIMGDAIRFIRRNVFEVGSRSRSFGVNVVQVAVVITDGQLDNRAATAIEAELAKQEGVLVFVVGVGKDVDLDDLKGISSLPSEYYTFLVDSFAGLAKIRDLVATKTCKVAESVRNTRISTTSATAARLAHARSVFIEAPLIREMSTKPASSNKESVTKAIPAGIPFEDVASTKTAFVKATLTKLVSPGMDSTSVTDTATSLPSRAPYIKSTFTRPTILAASTTAVSAAAAISPVVSTMTYYTTSASSTKLFSQTSVVPHENVSLAPSTEIASAQGSRKVEGQQPRTRGVGATKLPISVTITDGGEQREKSETVTFQQPRNAFHTNTSEAADELIATSSGFRAIEDSTDNPRKITGDLEIVCGLDKTLNGKSRSGASKKNGGIEDEKDVAEEQHGPTTTGSNGNGRETGVQQNDNPLSGCTRRNRTNTPAIVAQVTEGLNNTGTKEIIETNSTTTDSRMHVKDGYEARKSRLTYGTQRRKVVFANRNDKWDSDEPLIQTSGKGRNDEGDSDGSRSREGNERLNYESGYQAKDYWRLDNRGMLVRDRMVSPGVYKREKMASYRTPRLEPNPRRVVIQRSEATQSSAVEDRRGLDRSHFNQEMIDEESRENVSDVAHSGHTTYRSRLITRKKGRRGGFARGPEMRGTIRHGPHAALERKNHEPPRHHRPPMYTNGYWRLNDLGKLVWQNSTQNSPQLSSNHVTENLNIKSPDIYTMKTLNASSFKDNPDFPHTQSHLEVGEVHRLTSNSGAHPNLNAAKTTPRASFDDVIKSRSKQMTQTTDEQPRSTRTQVPYSQEINSHNPKEGFWKHDRYGIRSVWVSYARSDDVMSTGGTTDAPAMTFSNVNPTSSTKGPSLDDTEKLSHGYWKQDKGKLVWYEYQSPGIYRKVIDTDPLAVPRKIRMELPPGRIPGCRGCNLTSSPVWYSHGKVNRSASSEEMVVFRASDRVEKLVMNRTRPITLDVKKNLGYWQVLANLKQEFSEGLSENSNSSQFNASAKSRIQEISTLLDRIENKMSVLHHYNRSFLSSSDHAFNKIFQSSPLDSVVRGMNGTGNSNRNWTYENMESIWIRGFREMDNERGHSQRTRITTGMQYGLKENHGTSAISTTVKPRRDGTIWSATATRSVSSPSHIRRQLEPRNPNRVGDTASVRKRGSTVGQGPAPTKGNRKHARRCIARTPLDVVFVVDPRARKEPYTKELWQLAYEVVFQLQMDDERVRVRFYPDLEEVKAAAAANGSAGSGNIQTLIQKVAQKPVPELLRMASRLLAKSRKGVRRIGIYLTDGPSGTPQELNRAVDEVKTDAGVELFAVGVGQETDPAELETIADSKLKGKHLYRLTKPLKSDIDAVGVKLARALCGRR